MYFANRFQAGRMLSSRLTGKYSNKPCLVLALSEGGVIVAAEIARELHCIFNLLLTEEIDLPREPDAVGAITSEGDFTFNPSYNKYDLDEIQEEYREPIEEEKLVKIRKLTESLGNESLISRDLMVGHNIILVSDGLKSTFPLELARSYLKPIRMEKFIVATPLASVEVVDWMHVYADEIYCLSVVEEYTETDRYYYKNDIPTKEQIVKTVEKVVHNWV